MFLELGAATRRNIRPARSRSSFPTRPAAATTRWRASSPTRWAKTLGQQIVIENRGGAGGTIATRQVAKSRARRLHAGARRHRHAGHQPHALPQRRLRPAQGFAPVGLIATSALVVLVQPLVPAKIGRGADRARQEEPGKLNYASAGPGSGIHLGAELFASMAGISSPIYPTGAARRRSTTSSAATSRSISARCRPRSASCRGQGARAGRHRDRRARRRSPTCRRWPRPGCRATRPSCTTASPRRPARRGRSSKSSAPPCARPCLPTRPRPGSDRRRRAHAQHARGIRRRHRPRGDQVVAHRQRSGAKAD